MFNYKINLNDYYIRDDDAVEGFSIASICGIEYVYPNNNPNLFLKSYLCKQIYKDTEIFLSAIKLRDIINSSPFKQQFLEEGYSLQSGDKNVNEQIYYNNRAITLQMKYNKSGRDVTFIPTEFILIMLHWKNKYEYCKLLTFLTLNIDVSYSVLQSRSVGDGVVSVLNMECRSVGDFICLNDIIEKFSILYSIEGGDVDCYTLVHKNCLNSYVINKLIEQFRNIYKVVDGSLYVHPNYIIPILDYFEPKKTIELLNSLKSLCVRECLNDSYIDFNIFGEGRKLDEEFSKTIFLDREVEYSVSTNYINSSFINIDFKNSVVENFINYLNSKIIEKYNDLYNVVIKLDFVTDNGISYFKYNNCYFVHPELLVFCYSMSKFEYIEVLAFNIYKLNITNKSVKDYHDKNIKKIDRIKNSLMQKDVSKSDIYTTISDELVIEHSDVEIDGNINIPEKLNINDVHKKIKKYIENNKNEVVELLSNGEYSVLKKSLVLSFVKDIILYDKTTDFYGNNDFLNEYELILSGNDKYKDSKLFKYQCAKKFNLLLYKNIPLKFLSEYCISKKSSGIDLININSKIVYACKCLQKGTLITESNLKTFNNSYKKIIKIDSEWKQALIVSMDTKCSKIVKSNYTIIKSEYLKE